MVQLAGFLTALLHGLALIGLAGSVGAVAFVHAVLAGEAASPAVAALRARLVELVRGGSLLVTAALALKLLIGPWSLAEPGGPWPIEDFLATGYARASLLHLAIAVLLAAFAWLGTRGSPPATQGFGTLGVLALLLIASGAPLVHAVSRLEDVAQLLTLTMLHKVAAIVWVGSVASLLLAAHAVRGAPADPGLWPRLLARFSPLGMVCVAVIASTGLWMSFAYVGDWASLAGTNYGVMVLCKCVMLSAALFLAALNLRHTRAWRGGETEGVLRRVPAYVEGELGVLAVTLLLAATIASTPPATDLPGERATLGDVVETVLPKPLQLTVPPKSLHLDNYTPSDDYFNPPTEYDRIHSNFNHNVAGVFVFLIGIVAALDRAGLWRAARHWPLLFLPFGVFLLIVGEPTGWPLGEEGFFETLAVPSVLEHRLATVLVLVLGLMEWRVRAGGLAGTRWQYIFPTLCMVGGALLLTHSHTMFGTKDEFLIEVSHSGIGVLGVLMGAARLVEMRLPPPAPRLAGLVWTTGFMLTGWVLMFYKETL